MVSVRKVGEEPQIGVIRDALMVYLELIHASLYIVFGIAIQLARYMKQITE